MTLLRDNNDLPFNSDSLQRLNQRINTLLARLSQISGGSGTSGVSGTSGTSGAAGTGGGGNTIYTGDGTLAGNRVVNGNDNSLEFSNMPLITLDAEGVTLVLNAFSGSTFTGNVGIGTAPNADTIFTVNSGGNGIIVDKTNYQVTLKTLDNTALKYTTLQLSSGAGTRFSFYTSIDELDHTVSIVGNATNNQIILTSTTNNTTFFLDDTAQTITLTAANGFIVNGATGATDDVVIVGLTNTYTLHFSSGLYTGTTIT